MTNRAIVLVLITLLAVFGVMIFVEPMPQWPEYHDFADDRDSTFVQIQYSFYYRETES